jgi:hypothetical protein
MPTSSPDLPSAEILSQDSCFKLGMAGVCGAEELAGFGVGVGAGFLARFEPDLGGVGAAADGTLEF